MGMMKKGAAMLILGCLLLTTAGVWAADDAQGLSIAGVDVVLMNNYSAGAINAPYHIEGLQEGDTVKWTTAVTRANGLTWGGSILPVMVPNPSAASDTSADPWKKDALLQINTSPDGTKCSPALAYQPSLTINATVARGGTSIPLSKTIAFAQTPTGSDGGTKALYFGDFIYSTGAIPSYWKDAALAGDGEKYLSAAAGKNGMQKEFYTATGSTVSDDVRKRDDLLRQAFSGVYTVDASIRVSDSAKGARDALIFKSDTAASGTGEKSFISISIAAQIDSNGVDTGYDKFNVNGGTWETKTEKMFKRGWHDLKVIVNQPESSFTLYIDGVEFLKGAPFNPASGQDAEGRPMRALAFNKVQVRQLSAYSGYAYERHMDFVEQNKVVYTDKTQDVIRRYNIQTRFANYTCHDLTTTWKAPATDIIKRLSYPAHDGVAVVENLASQKANPAGDITVTVKPDASSVIFPVRIERGDNKLTYSNDVLYIRNYHFNFEDGMIPQAFTTTAAIAGEVGERYLDLSAKQAILPIDLNPASVLHLTARLRGGQMQLQKASGTNVLDLTSPATGLVDADIYFDKRTNTCYGTVGSDSFAVGIPDVSYKLRFFGTELYQLDAAEGTAAPYAQNVSISGEVLCGETLTGSYLDEPGSFSMQWYASGDGCNYVAIPDATQSTLLLTPELAKQRIKFAVTKDNGLAVFSPAVKKTQPVTISSDGHTITATASYKITDAAEIWLVLAAYDGETLLEARYNSIPAAAGETASLTAAMPLEGLCGKTFKAYLWDSKLQPLDDGEYIFRQEP